MQPWTAIKTINWANVWQQLVTAMDNTPRERFGMPDHTLDHYLPVAPHPAPGAAWNVAPQPLQLAAKVKQA